MRRIKMKIKQGNLASPCSRYSVGGGLLTRTLRDKMNAQKTKGDGKPKQARLIVHHTSLMASKIMGGVVQHLDNSFLLSAKIQLALQAKLEPKATKVSQPHPHGEQLQFEAVLNTVIF